MNLLTNIQKGTQIIRNSKHWKLLQTIMLRREHYQLLNILPNNKVTKGIIIDANEIIASKNERKLTMEVCEQT